MKRSNALPLSPFLVEEGPSPVCAAIKRVIDFELSEIKAGRRQETQVKDKEAREERNALEKKVRERGVGHT